jgi:hypothetical protein
MFLLSPSRQMWGVESRLGHYCFLPNPFQFISHPYHLTLYNLDMPADRVIK